MIFLIVITWMLAELPNCLCYYVCWMLYAGVEAEAEAGAGAGARPWVEV